MLVLEVAIGVALGLRLAPVLPELINWTLRLAAWIFGVAIAGAAVTALVLVPGYRWCGTHPGSAFVVFYTGVNLLNFVHYRKKSPWFSLMSLGYIVAIIIICLVVRES